MVQCYSRIFSVPNKYTVHNKTGNVRSGYDEYCWRSYWIRWWYDCHAPNSYGMYKFAITVSRL